MRGKWVKASSSRVVDLFCGFCSFPSFILLVFAVSPDVVAIRVVVVVVSVAVAVCSGRINILTHFIAET